MRRILTLILAIAMIGGACGESSDTGAEVLSAVATTTTQADTPDTTTGGDDQAPATTAGGIVTTSTTVSPTTATTTAATTTTQTPTTQATTTTVPEAVIKFSQAATTIDDSASNLTTALAALRTAVEATTQAERFTRNWMSRCCQTELDAIKAFTGQVSTSIGEARSLMDPLGPGHAAIVASLGPGHAAIAPTGLGDMQRTADDLTETVNGLAGLGSLNEVLDSITECEAAVIDIQVGGEICCNIRG